MLIRRGVGGGGEVIIDFRSAGAGGGRNSLQFLDFQTVASLDYVLLQQ